MLFSFGLIFVVGLLFAFLMQKISLPPLTGMLMTGLLLGPYVLNILDERFLDISADLRKIALLIILTRAGFGLDLSALKKAGRPAFLLCFVPAFFEIGGTILLAPKLLGLSLIDSAILGCVTAAVSPAIIVPKMLSLTQQRLGTNKGIPQMMMAGASVDDVLVIVLFSCFTNIASGKDFSIWELAQAPVSILLGFIGGILCGKILCQFFQRFSIRDTHKILLLLSLCFFAVTLEDFLKNKIAFSGLIAIIVWSTIIRQRLPQLALRLSARYTRLWIAAECLLFALVGAIINPAFLYQQGISAIVLLIFVLLLRMLGVFLCLLGTSFSKKERLFCMAAYLPKATVQAAIGAIPLSMGLAGGAAILSVAVISILITAPIGAFAMDFLAPRCLSADV